MQRIICALITCSILAGCAPAEQDSETAQSTAQALDVTATSGLTKMQGPILSTFTEEFYRQQDTTFYYDSVKIGYDGLSGDTITVGLPTLDAFIRRYGLYPGSEKVAKYYNRGDLGIGRDMHCVDFSHSTGEVACYVKNYFAGDDDSEFSFGLSNNIAFANMNAHRHFATVAMVFRKYATDSLNRVFFVVFNEEDKRANAAALDRVGVQFAAAFQGGLNPSGFGTPGQDFNNHIPSNCISCHGGQLYNTTNGISNEPRNDNKNQIGSLFLPFDLDQFDYDSTHPRDENAFRDLNKIVWNVAANSQQQDHNGSVRKQINLWYNNNGGGNLTGNFTQAVPEDWSSPQGSAVYTNVVRSACRNCHMTNNNPALHFDKESEFKAELGRTVRDLCSYAMPHSLQSLRQFWQSNQPLDLANYIENLDGGSNPTFASLASQLRSCGPGDVATLDPPLIVSTQGLL